MTLVVLAAPALAFPIAAAEFGVSPMGVTGQFGTAVRYGDADYAVPTLKKDSINVRVYEADLGRPGDVADDCVILDTQPIAGLSGTPFTPGAAFQDIRLTGCLGRPAGTQVQDADAAERNARWTTPGVFGVYADLNGNGKLDAGEYCYLTTAGPGATTFVASTSPTNFTIRLTSTPDYAAGTFVFPQDKDFTAFGHSAKNQTFTVSVRDDKEYFLLPKKTTDTGRTVGTLVPANSIRLGGSTQDVATVNVVGIEVLTDPITAGEKVQVMATVQNGGKVAGWGLVQTRMDGVVADVRASPVLSPTEKAGVLVTAYAPRSAGPVELEVGDVFQLVDVQDGRKAQQFASGAELSAADSSISGLQVRVAQLEAGSAARMNGIPAKGHSPALGGIEVVLVLGLGLGLVRRRDA